MISRFIKGRKYFLNTDSCISPVIFVPYESGNYVRGGYFFQRSTPSMRLMKKGNRPVVDSYDRYIDIQSIHESEDGFIIELK